MILYELLPNKVLRLRRDEDTFVTENLISSFNIIMPSTFGNYPTKELDFELRVYLPTVNNGQTEYSEYMGYPLTVENNRAVVPITNDITGDVQIDKVMILATKDGNVIGKTNFVDKPILNAPLKGDPLTPRKEFDEVINEQRATIESQGETITEQQGTISQQSSQITELNGEVTELQGEVAEQAATITRQNTTIDQLNRRVPPLESLDPINPSTQQVTYRPSGDNVGFNSFAVNGATCEGLGVNPEYYKAGEPCIDKVGSYNPVYGTTAGGIYITAKNEYGYATEIVIKDWTSKGVSLTLPFADNAKLYIQSIDFIGDNDFKAIPNNAFANYTSLENFSIIPTIRSVGINAFLNTSLLSEVEIPQTVTSVGAAVFQNSTVPKILFNANVTTVPVNFALSEASHASRYSPLEVYIREGVTSIDSSAFANRFELWKLYLPATLSSVGYNAFVNVEKIRELTLGSGWNMSFNVNSLTNGVDVDVSVIVSWLEALADRTGETAYTLTIGTTNLNKMTAEEKAIAINKNWNLA